MQETNEAAQLEELHETDQGSQVERSQSDSSRNLVQGKQATEK